MAYWNADKRVLQYNNWTCDLGSGSSGSDQLDINEFSETAWAGDTREGDQQLDIYS